MNEAMLTPIVTDALRLAGERTRQWATEQGAVQTAQSTHHGSGDSGQLQPPESQLGQPAARSRTRAGIGIMVPRQ